MEHLPGLSGVERAMGTRSAASSSSASLIFLTFTVPAMPSAHDCAGAPIPCELLLLLLEDGVPVPEPLNRLSLRIQPPPRPPLSRSPGAGADWSVAELEDPWVLPGRDPSPAGGSRVSGEG